MMGRSEMEPIITATGEFDCDCSEGAGKEAGIIEDVGRLENVVAATSGVINLSQAEMLSETMVTWPIFLPGRDSAFP